MTSTTVPVIFDLDGTLVDPAGGITDGIAAALRELGLPVPGQELLESMIGPKLSDSLLNVAKVPADRLAEVVRLYREYYVATGIAQSRLYPGIRDVLESFSAAGRPVAVATQKPQRLARTVLAHHGIDEFFHGIHGSADDETAVEGVPLGKTQIIAAALRDLDTRHAIMVGDRAQDVSGAIANGLDCIGVMWGFAPDAELEDAGSFAVVSDAGELLTVIDRLQAIHFAAMSGVSNDGNV
ncbi:MULTISPECIES: HAD hydrolase-like protein [unclassified Arthrobacter]|uniref:HAD hydrolase-like protein n=1 Tax=unclassified Arthrobacter TaxID=235627 RepID=UPI001C84D04C|nr:HAD hydrolase-like protein [Arthrobacter sp. MAHUQ-56]MBX7444274.1 HAD hydrolase-like protein [Arthrobacter sp. MAHUQ-56]